MGSTGECGQTIQAEKAPCTTTWSTAESWQTWKTAAAQGKGLAYVESKMGHSFQSLTGLSHSDSTTNSSLTATPEVI